MTTENPPCDELPSMKQPCNESSSTKLPYNESSSTKLPYNDLPSTKPSSKDSASEEWQMTDKRCEEASLQFIQEKDTAFGSFARQLFIMHLTASGLLSVDGFSGKVYYRTKTDDEFREMHFSPPSGNRDYPYITINTKYRTPKGKNCPDKNRTMKFEHHEIVVYGSRFIPVPYRHIIHHINGDKFDNRLTNLAVLTDEEHKEEHNIRKQYALYAKTLLNADQPAGYPAFTPITCRQRRIMYIAYAYGLTREHYTKSAGLFIKELFNSKFGASFRQIKGAVDTGCAANRTFLQTDFESFEEMRSEIDEIVDEAWMNASVYTRKRHPVPSAGMFGFTGLSRVPAVREYFLEKGYVKNFKANTLKRKMNGIGKHPE